MAQKSHTTRMAGYFSYKKKKREQNVHIKLAFDGLPTIFPHHLLNLVASISHQVLP